MAIIKAIFARDDNWGIGKDGQLPWPHNSSDLAWFKKCTAQQAVVMGRLTWESLPVAPLPNRLNYVISTGDPTSEKFKGAAGVLSGEDLCNDIISINNQLPDNIETLWVIGGSRLLENTFRLVDEIVISRVPGTYNCDTYLPEATINLLFNLHSTQNINGLQIETWRKLL